MLLFAKWPKDLSRSQSCSLLHWKLAWILSTSISALTHEPLMQVRKAILSYYLALGFLLLFYFLPLCLSLTFWAVIDFVYRNPSVLRQWCYYCRNQVSIFYNFQGLCKPIEGSSRIRHWLQERCSRRLKGEWLDCSLLLTSLLTPAHILLSLFKWISFWYSSRDVKTTVVAAQSKQSVMHVAKLQVTALRISWSWFICRRQEL